MLLVRIGWWLMTEVLSVAECVCFRCGFRPLYKFSIIGFRISGVVAASGRVRLKQRP